MNKTTLISIITFFMVFNLTNVLAVDHAFNYQGELMDNNAPATGTYNFTIQAYTDSSGNNAVGLLAEYKDATAVTVTNGLFSLESVDLGIATYDGLNIWLQISVKNPADAVYTPLTPLQKMQSVPYATTLIDKGAADGQVLTFDNANGWQPANANSGTDNQNIANLGLSSTTLTVGIENGNSQNVDLSSLQDGMGTDDQNIANLDLSGTTLTVGIEGGTSQNVDLVSLQDGTGTDTQTLSVSANNLTITGGNSVILPSKSTYTVWGRTACGSGDTQLYTGIMSSIASASGSGSNPICLNNSVTAAGWTPWDKGLVWRANHVAGSNRGQYLSSASQVDCSICQGDIYVNWGEQTCAPGWSTVYDGFISTFATNEGAAWSAGGLVCLDDSQAGSWTPWDQLLVIRALNSGGSNRVQYQNSNDMRCRVCN